MSLLQSITKGKTPKPPRIIIYGTEGVGKSTWASQAPNPVFVQTEDGINEIDCAKFPLAHNFEEVMSELTALLNEPHEYQTVVVDSLDDGLIAFSNSKVENGAFVSNSDGTGDTSFCVRTGYGLGGEEAHHTMLVKVYIPSANFTPSNQRHIIRLMWQGGEKLELHLGNRTDIQRRQ